MVYIGVKMNDLIKEFAVQAGFKVNFQHEDHQAIRMAQYKEFAELIINECVEVLSDKRFDNVRPTMNIAQAMIKQHLGIKE
jgi:hypothetical protein